MEHDYYEDEDILYKTLVKYFKVVMPSKTFPKVQRPIPDLTSSISLRKKLPAFGR